jgi:hypothetical protein
MPFDVKDTHVGPGKLWVAPYATALPTDPSTALNVAFKEIGDTLEGSTFGIEPNWETFRSAERFHPLWRVKTEEDATVEFDALAISEDNLKYWHNGGTIATGGTGATTFQSFAPPAATATPIEVSLIHESTGATGFFVRTVWPRLINTGDLSLANTKEDLQVLHFAFTLLEPASGSVYYRYKLTPA